MCLHENAIKQETFLLERSSPRHGIWQIMWRADCSSANLHPLPGCTPSTNSLTNSLPSLSCLLDLNSAPLNTDSFSNWRQEGFTRPVSQDPEQSIRPGFDEEQLFFLLLSLFSLNCMLGRVEHEGILDRSRRLYLLLEIQSGSLNRSTSPIQIS